MDHCIGYLLTIDVVKHMVLFEEHLDFLGSLLQLLGLSASDSLLRFFDCDLFDSLWIGLFLLIPAHLFEHLFDHMLVTA